MTRRMSAALVTGLGALVLGVGTFAAPQPWQAGAAAPAPQQPQGGGGGGGRGRGPTQANVAGGLYTVLNADRSETLTRDELKATFDKWYTAWDKTKAGSVGADVVQSGLAAAFAAQPSVAPPADVEKMMAALPAKAPAKPAQRAQGAGLRALRRLRALLGPADRQDGRGPRQQDGRVDDDGDVRPGGHQPGQSETVRRDRAREHDRLLPR